MRLITFGDSWTAGHGVEDDIQYKEVPFPNMFTQKLRKMNSWPRWVADKLGCVYVNLGVCGFGNEFILNEIKSVKKDGHLNKDDTIIVMLSYPYRYTGDTYNVIEIYQQMEEELKEYNHFYFNSFFPTFVEEDFDTSKLPKYFIDPNGCVSDILREYEIKNGVGVWEYGCRSVWNDKENFYEGDYHPNLEGYKIMANHIYGKIVENKFNEFNIPIWNEHLRNMEKELEWYTPNIKSDVTHYAMTLEPRIHEDLYITMKTCMYYLNETNSTIKWGLQIFCGNDNYEYIKEMVKDWGEVIIVNLNIKSLSKVEYNTMFRDAEFWKTVKGDKVFTFQLDSILLRSGIDEFLDYDYIGAPWRKPKEGSYVGNGGLSLRTRDVMLEISKTNKIKEVIWEDIYFVKCLKGRGVADIETAKKFSMEDVYSPNPLGVHYPIKYIEPELLKKVLFKK